MFHLFVVRGHLTGLFVLHIEVLFEQLFIRVKSGIKYFSDEWNMKWVVWNMLY